MRKLPASFEAHIADPWYRLGDTLSRRVPVLAQDERDLVGIFVHRYTEWCARTSHYDRIRGAIDLLVRVNRAPLPPPEPLRMKTHGSDKPTSWREPTFDPDSPFR